MLHRTFFLPPPAPFPVFSLARGFICDSSFLRGGEKGADEKKGATLLPPPLRHKRKTCIFREIKNGGPPRPRMALVGGVKARRRGGEEEETCLSATCNNKLIPLQAINQGGRRALRGEKKENCRKRWGSPSERRRHSFPVFLSAPPPPKKCSVKLVWTASCRLFSVSFGRRRRDKAETRPFLLEGGFLCRPRSRSGLVFDLTALAILMFDQGKDKEKKPTDRKRIEPAGSISIERFQRRPQLVTHITARWWLVVRPFFVPTLYPMSATSIPSRFFHPSLGKKEEEWTAK